MIIAGFAAWRIDFCDRSPKIFRRAYVLSQFNWCIAIRYFQRLCTYYTNSGGQSFWARGYYVSTVGRDEETVRNYIKHQESEDKRIEQLDLF
jgi:REP element-mobilizing transposase RayT